VTDRVVIEVLYAAIGLLELVLDRSLGFFFAAADKRQMNPTFVTTVTERGWRKL
jgi:hypothetical protein